MNRWFGLLSLIWCVPAVAGAQDTTAVVARPVPTITLSLDDALQQARANSPTYRQVLNDAAPAKWGVRNAYGNLMPQLNVSTDLGYIGSGQSNFGGGFIRPTSAFLTSGYNLGVFWQLDGRALSGPGQQKALRRATDEDISGAGVDLRAEIETQYLNTLQATAQVGVARQQVSRNADFLALAKARYQVGQATLLDVRQAEVIKGQSDVALLRAVQTENEAKLDLIRRMGVEPPVPVEQIALSDSFPVTEPAFNLDTLLTLADAQNPALRSLRARSTAASWNVRAAKSEFLPTLQVQAGWSGFTQQFTNNDLLLGQSLADAQSQAADCQYNNQIRSALNLGGEVGNCFASSGLQDGAARSSVRWISRSGITTTPSPSTIPVSRSRPTFGSRCRSSPASGARSACLRPRRRRTTPTRSRAPGGCRCGATSTPATSGSRRPTRQSPCSPPAAKPLATSSAWRRIAIDSAPGRRSRCRTRRTPFSRPKVVTSTRSTITTKPSPRSKPRSAAHFANEGRTCRAG